MGQFKQYIRKLENKQNSFFKINSPIFIKSLYWEKDILKGEIISVDTGSIKVCVCHDFNKPYQSSDVGVAYFSISLLKTEYNKRNSIRLFLKETGEELPQEMLI